MINLYLLYACYVLITEIHALIVLILKSCILSGQVLLIFLNTLLQTFLMWVHIHEKFMIILCLLYAYYVLITEIHVLFVLTLKSCLLSGQVSLIFWNTLLELSWWECISMNISWLFCAYYVHIICLLLKSLLCLCLYWKVADFQGKFR